MELHMSGEETELDRTVIDEIGDPLQHLLRNSGTTGLSPMKKELRLEKMRLGIFILMHTKMGIMLILRYAMTVLGLM